MMDYQTIIVVLNLIFIEVMLSVDNSAVLAIMVKDLPKCQKPRALKYGLVGAYLFRGICLLLATWLIKVMWLKIAGGLYLLWLAYGHFTAKNYTIEEGVHIGDSKIFRFGRRLGLSQFWSTVILVECMDVAFSIDNVLAAVALSDKFWVIMAGVAIGILAMRFVAGWFVSIMEKYPSLEHAAFVVISLLGLKLVMSGLVDYMPSMVSIKHVLESHIFDLCFSAGMMGIFFYPVLFKRKRRVYVN